MQIYNKSYDLTKEIDKFKFIDFLRALNLNKYPFIVGSLLTVCDIEDIPENKKEGKTFAEQPLAYTYYNHRYERIKIHINFERFEKDEKLAKPGKKIDHNDIFMVIVHEFLHNLFMHCGNMRPKLNELAKQNQEICNIVEDYFCNDFIEVIMNKNFENFNLQGIHYDSFNDWFKNITDKYLTFGKCEREKRPFEEKLIEEIFKQGLANGKLQQKTMSGGAKGLEKNGSKKGKGKPDEEGSGVGKSSEKEELKNFDDHEVGKEAERKSKKEANEERAERGERPMSESDFDKLAELKISASVQESAKQAGQGEECLARFIKGFKKKDPFLNYISIKETLKLVSAEHKYATYSKPNRKRHVEDIIHKGKRKEEGKFCVVGIDVSGSVSDKELMKIYDIVGSFLNSNSHHTSVDVIFWSSCKIEDKHFHKNISTYEDLLKLKVASDGGTNVSTLYEFIEEKYAKKKVTLINITDGCYHYDKQAENISKEYIVLTDAYNINNIQKAYPNANVKNIRIYE